MSSNKNTANEEIKKVQKKNGKKSKIPMIIGFLAILGIVGVGAWFLLNNPNKNNPTDTDSATIAPGNPATPTEAYKKLYEAVSSKNSDAIKAMMSKDSIGLAEMQAGQSKKEISEVLKNGFLTANMAPKLPAIRDERVDGKFGAVEVFSQKRNDWENVPFIIEGGAWKLAVGNLFAGSFKSPGKARSVIEKENANAAGNRDMVPYGNNSNVNFNAKPTIIDPMKEGKIPPMPEKDSEKPADEKK